MASLINTTYPLLERLTWPDEITVHPLRPFGMECRILFQDILVIPQAMISEGADENLCLATYCHPDRSKRRGQVIVQDVKCECVLDYVDASKATKELVEHLSLIALQVSLGHFMLL